MPRTRVKICGVRDPRIAAAAAAAGADAVGLVFVERSPRFVTLDQARAVRDALPAFVDAVGVFAGADAETIRVTARALALTIVQLHGGEGPDFAASLAPLRVVKAVTFQPDSAAADIPAVLRTWANVPNLAALLWDAPPPPEASPCAPPEVQPPPEVPPSSGPAPSVAGLTGGFGVAFDWHALAAAMHDVTPEVPPPTILAGGLTPENVADAIAAVHPYAVDVSSGVEAARGVKDPDAIARFCEAVRGGMSG